jgi:hypothetical protein
MSRKLIAVAAVALLFVLSHVAEAAAPFCWDQTDQMIVKLKKVKLTNVQLQDVFAYQVEHRAVMKAAHTEGLGCRHHEAHEVEFQKSAIGVLDDEQFKTFTGRVRTEAEALRYENYLLKKELEALKRELAALRAEMAQAARD